MVRLAPSWEPREPPLAPRGVVGLGEAGRRLARRAVARGAEGLRGLAGDGLVLLAGESLPWADGAIYVAPDPSAPALWLPTQLQPAVHSVLVARALGLRGHTGPHLLLPRHRVLVPLSSLRPVDSDWLRQWLT